MASKGNLVPVLIADKNGKLTTVYKRDDNIKWNDSKGIIVVPPAPATTTTPVMNLERERLISDIVDSWNVHSESTWITQRVAVNLSRYSDDLLAILKGASDDDTEAFGKLGTSLLNGEPEKVIRMELHLFTYTGDLPYYSAKAILDALDHYEQVSDVDFIVDDNNEGRLKCAALVTVTAELFESGMMSIFEDEHPPYVIDDKQLVDVIVDHADRADLVVSAIRSGGSLDPVVLRSMLESEPSALTQGML